MANVGIDPTANVDFQAFFNAIKEHRPFLGHLRSMHYGHKSAIYKVVPDFHILLKVLGQEMGVLVPHYSPPSTLFTDLIADFLHVGRFYQII